MENLISISELAGFNERATNQVNNSEGYYFSQRANILKYTYFRSMILG